MKEMKISYSITAISRWTYNLLVKWGLNEDLAAYVNLFALLFALIILVYLTQHVVRRMLRIVLIRISKRTDIKFFHHLLNNRLPHYLALIATLVLINAAIPVIFIDFPDLIKPMNVIADVYLVLIIIWMVMAIIRAGGDDLRTKPAFREKPIDSYMQVIRMILFLIGAVVIFSNLTGKSPLAFFTAMGAISAVLLLMFKDTIMGFVASIQVTANDTVRIGDWITMPKYGADGDVIEINLTTVKVQNFDKTITTIPTYSLISDSFQNWRGMSQAGGRRIKRAIFIKQSTIRFITPAELEKFKKIQSLTSYIEHRQKDIDKNNERLGIDKSLLLNGRNLTNAGLYRKYIDTYIANHSGTHKKMTMMVRHLAPTANGLPLELYVFTSTTKWADYEHIMADIFDHLIAAAPFFDLQIYESEASGDMTTLSFTDPLTINRSQ
ncbi:mechanosensitive ion channel family protein [Pedobacter sp. MR2016-24]|uniref:mechanosensitive ion channel family protein n=1 Tax=Pedobacter sp. MR2016-24 TaxID=2994466 RepID=UPI0022475558|nr:mechanosensitive ion channel domain-containing protein [Pedobacter sp. MR2016-24]MCX2482435.1 mechanosensitive ion channel [Pedobacter sp. MR2016-24]